MHWRHHLHKTMAAEAGLLATCTLVIATLVVHAQHYGSVSESSYETGLMHAPPPPPPPHCVLTIKPINGTSNSYTVAPTESSYLSNYAVSRHGYANAYTGHSICITQHDVDSAVEEAKASLGGYVPKEIYTANSELPKPMQVSVVAEIITQATRILANRFKLPEPSILYDLPSIDLSKSASIDRLCPVFLKPGVNCEHTKFRTLTGFCNNLQYQSWGSSRSAMVRFLAPDYYDSISLPRRAYDGSPLPSARVVSFVVHQDPPEYDKYHSMLSVVWGQFIDHDMTLAVQASDENPEQEINCCKSEDAHPDCFPIEIPKGDPFYGYFNQKCMHFTRASAGLQPGCSLGPVQAMNKISGYMDGSLVYGSSIKVSQRLRTYQGGQLRTQPVSSVGAYGSAVSSAGSLAEAYANHANANSHDQASSGAGDYLLSSSSSDHAAIAAAASSPTQRQQALAMEASLEYATISGADNSHHMQSYPQLKPLLPAKKHSPDTGCERRGRAKDVYCFEAGDARANEQIQLTTLHTMFLREHNRIAKELSYINPHWDDERLFQEARQIVVAEMQHITFNEFLPLVIGKEKIYEYGLELEHPGKYYHGYDSKINAGIRVEFQAAAFRYGHSILPSYIERYNKYHQKIEAIRLSKLLKQPYDLYHPGVVDTYLLGLANQRAGRMDPTLTTEVTNHLFEKPGKFFGIDLAAINIQRGRDMGVPGYNHFREYCGLPKAKYFEDLTGVFSNKTLLRMSQLYKHVDDIDLWTAGISEYPIQDGLVGPTFACLIARQFVNLRRGDRFWYENDGYPPQFTIEELDEIRKSTSARLICDNSDDIDSIQASPMLIADPYTNPRVSCSSLPSMDLSKWREQQQGSYGPPAAPQQGYSAPQHQAPQYSSPAPALEHVDIGSIDHNALAAAPMSSHDSATASAIDEYMSSGGTAEAYLPSETMGHYEPVREHRSSSNNYNTNSNSNNVQHQFVDHLVELANYRPEMTSYQSAGKAKAAAAAAAAAA